MLKQPKRIEKIDSYSISSSSTSFLELLLVHLFVRCVIAHCFRNFDRVAVHICWILHHENGATLHTMEFDSEKEYSGKVYYGLECDSFAHS